MLGASNLLGILRDEQPPPAHRQGGGIGRSGHHAPFAGSACFLFFGHDALLGRDEVGHLPTC